MDSNQIKIKRIINSLFIKEKEWEARTELDDYIHKYLIKMGRYNKEEFISNLLNSFKKEIFDETKEYIKELEKEITPILIIQNIIKIYSKNPYNFFILLNPLFDMYKHLDSNKIAKYTEKIRELLEDENIIILKNFNELFEVIIVLIVNQNQSAKEEGEKLNNLLKSTLDHSLTQLDNKYIFDFELFEKKILEKTHINQPILDLFLLDWINKICELEPLNQYLGKLFYDIIPWIFQIKNNSIKDIANKAIDCDNKLKKIFLNKYLKYYYKENKQINNCILSFIKLFESKNNSEINKEYIFLYELINKFIIIIEENIDKGINVCYDNSAAEVNSPKKKRGLKKAYKEGDLKKENILYSPTVFFSLKSSKIKYDPNKNSSKSSKIIFDSLKKEPEINSYELAKLIPLDILNNFMELIIECNDITKEEQLNKLNSELKKLIEYIPNNYEEFNSKEFLNTIIKGVEKPEIINKDYLLDWYQLLYEKYESKVSDESITSIINSILKTIQDQFQDKIKNRNLMILMFQKLKNLNLKKIFSLLIDSLNKINDFYFIYQIDEYINYYLISTPRIEGLTKDLIQYGKYHLKEDKDFYEKIYRILAYNPICLLVFCIITEYYELSWNLIINFSKIKFDDSYYMHLSEFVHLIENTQFNHIRMLLLNPQKNIYLTKTLYGILMLLPQGKAYNILSDILYSIKSLFRNIKEIDIKIDENIINDINYFVNIFIEVHKKKN